MTDNYNKPDADDLKARLRGSCYLAFEDGTNDYGSAPDAADRIEQLEAALTQSREEMAKLLAMNDAGYDTVTKRAVAAAYERAAVTLDKEAASLRADASRFRGGTDPHHYRMDFASAAIKQASAIRALATPDQTAALDKLIDEAVKPYVDALRALIYHTHECERELTEALYHADFCGESRPLTDARAILAASKKGGA